MITTADLKVKLIDGLGLEDIEVDEIGDDMALFGDDGLGLDSVDAIEITLIVEKEFGVKIKDAGEESGVFSTPNTLVAYINENK
ncbi:MAG TPA: acyl carrier protein [Sulfurospirillum arcachonense]|nr:acyl carrier protein [Sulfurospirillum arcachonense]HIP45522.1 acyl carrier protein [Sulfurospirillum arcachonense]